MFRFLLFIVCSCCCCGVDDTVAVVIPIASIFGGRNEKTFSKLIKLTQFSGKWCTVSAPIRLATHPPPLSPTVSQSRTVFAFSCFFLISFYLTLSKLRLLASLLLSTRTEYKRPKSFLFHLSTRGLRLNVTTCHRKKEWCAKALPSTIFILCPSENVLLLLLLFSSLCRISQIVFYQNVFFTTWGVD